MAPFDPDDLSLLATLAENPTLSRSAAYAGFLRDLKPQSRKLAQAIVSEAAPAAAGGPVKSGSRKSATGARKKVATRKTKAARSKGARKMAARKSSAMQSKSIATRRARSILKWAKENRSRRK